MSSGIEVKLEGAPAYWRCLAVMALKECNQDSDGMVGVKA